MTFFSGEEYVKTLEEDAAAVADNIDVIDEVVCRNKDCGESYYLIREREKREPQLPVA